MLKKIRFRNNLLVFGIPLLMVLSLITVVKSPFFVPEVSNFIVLDFLIIIPFVYFLLIKEKEISNKTTFTLAILGLFISGFILPKENQEIITVLKTYLLPLVEVFLIGFVIIKGRNAFKILKEKGDKTLDFYDVMKRISSDVFPSFISGVFAAEISVVYYGVFNWRKKKLKENEFSYHKEGTAISVILGFLLVVVVEMFVTHSMMKMGSTKGTVILIALSVYSILQVISVLKSLTKRPIFIDCKKQQINLKFGILANAIIPFKNIKRIEVSTKELSEKTDIKYFSPLGKAAGHNVIIHLENELKFESFYGFKKKAKSLAVFVDKKHEFVEILKNIKNEK